MKQTQIQLGGWEAQNDDIQYIQDGAVESFAAIVKAFGNGHALGFRLWGLDMVLSNADLTLTWTGGAMAMDGEIFLVAAGTVSRPNSITHTFRFLAVDNIGQTMYTGSGLLDTRNNRVATLAPAALAIPPLYTEYDAPFIHDLINPKYVKYNISPSNVTAAHNFTGPVSGTLVSADALYRLTNKTVDLNIALVYTLADVADSIDIDLPAGMVSTGYFAGTAVINGQAMYVSCLEDDTTVKLSTLVPTELAATTQFIFLQFRLEVK